MQPSFAGSQGVSHNRAIDVNGKGSFIDFVHAIPVVKYSTIRI